MSEPNEVTLEDAPDEITRAFEAWRVEVPSRTVGYFHGDEVGIAQAAFRAGYEKARAAVSVAATVSELTSDEIAQEFNRREWRGREDWQPMQMPDYGASPFDRPCIAIFSDGVTYEPRTRIQIEDARALIAGWRAQEELATLQTRLQLAEAQVWSEANSATFNLSTYDQALALSETRILEVTKERNRAQEELAALKAANQPSYHISTKALANLIAYWGKRAAKDGLGPWYDMGAFEAMLDLQRARLQLAALTAEVERLKTEVNRDRDYLCLDHIAGGMHENVDCIACFEVEQLREPAEGVDAVAQRIANAILNDNGALQIATSGGRGGLFYSPAGAALVIAAELKKHAEERK